MNRRAALEAIAFGDDPGIRPADRLRALELLADGERVEEVPFLREVMAIPADELDAELDALLARDVLGEEGRFPLLAAALRAEVERRVREIAEASSAFEAIAQPESASDSDWGSVPAAPPGSPLRASRWARACSSRPPKGEGVLVA